MLLYKHFYTLYGTLPDIEVKINYLTWGNKIVNTSYQKYEDTIPAGGVGKLYLDSSSNDKKFKYIDSSNAVLKNKVYIGDNRLPIVKSRVRVISYDNYDKEFRINAIGCIPIIIFFSFILSVSINELKETLTLLWVTSKHS